MSLPQPATPPPPTALFTREFSASFRVGTEGANDEVKLIFVLNIAATATRRGVSLSFLSAHYREDWEATSSRLPLALRPGDARQVFLTSIEDYLDDNWDSMVEEGRRLLEEKETERKAT